MRLRYKPNAVVTERDYPLVKRNWGSSILHIITRQIKVEENGKVLSTFLTLCNKEILGGQTFSNLKETVGFEYCPTCGKRMTYEEAFEKYQIGWEIWRLFVKAEHERENEESRLRGEAAQMILHDFISSIGADRLPQIKQVIMNKAQFWYKGMLYNISLSETSYNAIHVKVEPK